jgi:hypothetical protein
MVKNIFNDDEQYIPTDKNEWPDDYKHFQEKLDNVYN